MMGKTSSPPLTRRKKRKKKGDDWNTKDEGNDFDDEKEEGSCFVDEIAKRVKLCASITGKADDEDDDAKVHEDAFAATVLASTKSSSSSSSYAEMNSVLKRVHFEAKERWERRRATARAETDGIMK